MSKIQKLPWRDIVFLFGAVAAGSGVALWSGAAALLCGGLAICGFTVWVSKP